MFDMPYAGVDPEKLRRRTLEARAALARARVREIEQNKLAFYIQRVAPWFIIEEVHVLMCEYIEMLVDGFIDRLMIFMPPRTGKSMTASVFAPSWYIGKYPKRKIMQASYAADLAVDFGRNVRDIVADPLFQDVFPGVSMRSDNKAAGRWAMVGGGQYFATGVTGGVAGRGFNFGIIDDPLSEQDAFSDPAKEFVHKWYGPGFYTRRQPDFSHILYMGTRWSKDDLAGYLLDLKKDQPEADDWEVLRIPAIIDQDTADRLNEVAASDEFAQLRELQRKAGIAEQYLRPHFYREGDSFAPRRWPLKELLRQKANMPELDWLALYQQDPVAEAGNILKRRYWKEWKGKEPPKVEYVVQVYDTAFEESEEADFTARTTWGVFQQEERVNADGQKTPTHCAILLERFNQRIGFPELREEAIASFKKWKPDRVIVEKRASGHSLIQELRRARVPVTAIKQDKSKLARVHASAVVLEQGCVYYMKRNWADEVIQQCADFPNDDHDDMVDTCAMAWLWLRRTFHLSYVIEQEIADREEREDVDLMPRRLYW